MSLDTRSESSESSKSSESSDVSGKQSKTRSSFYRRLYVAYLIDSGLATSVPALSEVTGMPRRTAQDTLAALAELDIVCAFEQQAGERNHSGRYVIRDWGAIDPQWVAANLARIKRVLDYP